MFFTFSLIMTIEIPFFLLPLYLLTLPSTWIALASFLFLFLFFWLIASIFGFFDDLKKIDGRYAFARKRVAEKLAQDSSPESVTILANAVASNKDQAVIKIAVSALNRLRSQETIDALYKVWEETKHKNLTTILKKRRYVATELNLQVLFALKIGALDTLKKNTDDILEILLLAIDDRDTQIASAASNCIATLTNRKTIDTICGKWIENPNPRLQAIIQQGNYEPNEASIKALFYFLLGEWKKYEDLDFDQSLLTRAYQSASKEIQARIGEKAKAEGRIEWVKILTSNKRGCKVEKITDMDWETFIDILESHPDRKEIWKFLYNAPAIWSKKLLDKLVKSSGNWLVKDDKVKFNKLFSMAENLREQDFILFKSSEDQDLDFLTSSESQEISPRIIQDYRFVRFIDENTIATRTRIEPESWGSWKRGEFFLLNLLHGDCLKSVTTPWVSGNLAYWKISDDGSILVSCFTPGNIFDLDEIPFTAYFSSLSDGKDLVDITINISRNDLHSKDFPIIEVNTSQKIIFSSYDNTISFWSLSKGNLIKTITTNRTKLIMFSSNNYLLTADSMFYDSLVRDINLWSLPDGNLLKTFPNIPLSSLAISPDEKVLATGYQDGSIHLWSLSNGNEMGLLEGHTGSINSVSISPNGKTLASSSDDGTICLWSLPNCEHLKTIKSHINERSYYSRSDTTDISVAISPNGRVLVSNHVRYLSSDTIAKSSDCAINIWTSPNIPISKFTSKDIAEIKRKTKDYSLEEGTRNAFKFTLELIRLRQQFDIDIEDSSNNFTSSEFDIEIE